MVISMIFSNYRVQKLQKTKINNPQTNTWFLHMYANFL